MSTIDNCACKKGDCKKCLQIIQDKLDKMQERLNKFDERLNKFDEDINELKADIKSLGQYYKRIYPDDPNFQRF